MKKIILSFLLLCQPVLGATYYVNKAGSDSNSCATAQSATDSNAKLSIAAGIGCATSGSDTVIIGNGTYTESLSSFTNGSSWSAFTLITAENVGTCGVPGGTCNVIVQANNNDSNIINMSGSTQYIEIRSIKLQQGSGAANGVGGNPGAHHIRFRNVEIADINGNQGLLIENGCHHWELIGMNVHGVGPTSFEHGAYIGGDDHIIENGYWWGNVGNGIQMLNSANLDLPDRCHLRGNRFFNNGVHGLVYVNGENGVVYNNWFYDNQVGFEMLGIGHKALFNTSFSNDNEGIRIHEECNNCSVIGNVLWSNGSGGTTRCVNLPAVAGIDISTAFCNAVISENHTTNPTFVNEGTRDLHLQSTSTAIDSFLGAVPSEFSTDFDGEPRPIGLRWDRGADEFGDVPPSSFSVLTPNGGESVQVGAVLSITWASTITGGGSQSQTFNASGSWTAPAGVTSAQVEGWGGGGGGGGNSTTADGGGGGGAGAYGRKNAYTVVPGNSYTVTVGNGGAGGVGANCGSAGGDTQFDPGLGLLVGSGSGGCNPISGAAGTPGVGASGGLRHDITFPGGTGGAGRDSATGTGGGGGGSAGLTSAGGNGTAGAASPGAGGTAGTGSPAGAAGGAGGAAGANGNPGNTPGAGGGGSGDTGTRTGGAGAPGRVIVSWGTSANVSIELSRNGGTSWETLSASTPDDGAFDWTAAGAATTQGRIRVTSLAGGGETDTSNANFTIAASGVTPTITVTSPTTGQAFKPGDSIPVGWTSTNVSGNVRVDVTYDNGTTWVTVIASTAFNSSAQVWIASPPASSLYKIRVVSLNDPSVVGTMTGNFRVRGQILGATQ